MRFVLISDTHTKHKEIQLPKGDVLISAGDHSYIGKFEEVSHFTTWFGQQDFKYKIAINGNHELTSDPSSSFKGLMDNLFKQNNIHLLDDSGLEIEGFKIWGSSWQPTFNNWAYNLDRGEPLRQKWKLIPDDIDILVTHSPPHGINDETIGNEHVGCEELRKRIDALYNLKLAVHGHIHHARSHKIRYINNQKIHFVNASICDESYQPTNKPIIVDL